jgi:Putative metal-binding motif
MTPSIRGSLLGTVLVAASCLAPSIAAASFDFLPGETLGDTPYRSAALFDATAEFNSEHFTEEQPELTSPGVFLACGGRGAKTGWVRFATAVAGKLRVGATTTGPDDIFYTVYAAPTTTPSFGDLHQIACQDGLDGQVEEYSFGHEVPANTVAFVQVLVQCQPIEPACEKPERDAAVGGQTTVRLRFTPFNADGDSLPDSIDGCPAVAGEFRGCPDADRDGVGDADDACPAAYGRAPNGCRRGDEDGDGYIATAGAGQDCNDDDPAIHPGARDVPRNGVDEDCDGRDRAYPRVENEVAAVSAWSPRLGRTIGFLAALKVAGPFAKGMAVTLHCQGRGCPISRQAVTTHAGTKSVAIGGKLVGSTLAPGAKVTLVITRPEYIGEAMRYTIRRQGKVKVETLCVPVGGTSPRKKCE